MKRREKERGVGKIDAIVGCMDENPIDEDSRFARD